MKLISWRTQALRKAGQTQATQARKVLLWGQEGSQALRKAGQTPGSPLYPLHRGAP